MQAFIFNLLRMNGVSSDRQCSQAKSELDGCSLFGLDDVYWGMLGQNSGFTTGRERESMHGFGLLRIELAGVSSALSHLLGSCMVIDLLLKNVRPELRFNLWKEAELVWSSPKLMRNSRKKESAQVCLSV